MKLFTAVSSLLISFTSVNCSFIILSKSDRLLSDTASSVFLAIIFSFTFKYNIFHYFVNIIIIFYFYLFNQFITAKIPLYLVPLQIFFKRRISSEIFNCLIVLLALIFYHCIVHRNEEIKSKLPFIYAVIECLLLLKRDSICFQNFAYRFFSF